MTTKDPGLFLTEDDIDDLNAALSMAYVGSNFEDAGGSGDSGVHLRELCGNITRKLCAIRNRHGDGMTFNAAARS